MTPGLVLALQRSAGNAIVARAFRQATITKASGLHKTKQGGTHVRTGGALGSGTKLKIKAGSTIDVDDAVTKTDSRGTVYVRAMAGGRIGWLKQSRVPAPADEELESVDESTSADSDSDSDAELELEDSADAGPREKAAGPKAGFELEFKNIFIVPNVTTKPAMDHPHWPVWLLLKAIERGDESGLTKGKPLYKKRHVICRAPNKTWALTADTSFTFASNLEIVSAPLTPEELEGAEAAEDWDALEILYKTLRSGTHRFAPVRRLDQELGLGLVEVEDAVLIDRLPGSGQDFVQLTQAVMAGPADAPGHGWTGTWLPGLNPAGWKVLLDLITALTKTSYEGGNPKGVFGHVLPKTSITNVLGQPDEDALTDNSKTEWVEAVGASVKTGAFRLDDDVAAALVAKSQGKPEQLEATGFSWRRFLTELLDGTDLVAIWAKTAFSGEEDFGYGMLDDPDDPLPPGWYVAEQRQHGHQELDWIRDRQKEWATTTRKNRPEDDSDSSDF